MKPAFCHLGVADSYNLDVREYPTINDWMRGISSLRNEVDEGFLLNFGGPGVLVKEGFLDLVSFSRKQGFKISAETNACLIDADMARKINDSGIEHLNIAFDFPDKDEGGSFKNIEDLYLKVAAGISYLDRFVGSQLHKGISCVINDLNVESILQFENWFLRGETIDWVQFMVLGRKENKPPDNEWYKTGEYETLWPRDTQKVRAAIDDLIRIKKLGYKINNPVSQLEDFKSYYESPAEFVNKSKCNFANVIQVNPVGDIFLCQRFDKIGNIKFDDLKKVWQDITTIKTREAMASCGKHCHYLLNSYSLDGGISIIKENKPLSAPALGARLKPAEVNSVAAVAKPGFCCLGITNKCMFKCKMCYKWQDNLKEEYPTIAQYKNFISNLKRLVDKGFIINFGGGETLLFEGLFDLIKFASENEFLTHAISNGWLIDKPMAKRIADSGLNGINLSLDSLNEDTHDYLRGVKGSYRRVMDAIDYLHKYCKNTEVGICCVIYDWNLNELLPLLEWAAENKKLSSIIFMVPMQPNSTSLDKEWRKGKHGFLWPKDPDQACSFVDKVIEFKRIYNQRIGNPVAQLEAFKLYLRSPERFVKKTKCNLDRALHVSASGDIFLCFRWEHLGSVKDDSDIGQLWYSRRTNQVRQKIDTCRDNCHFLLNCFFEGDYPFGME